MPKAHSRSSQMKTTSRKPRGNKKRIWNPDKQFLLDRNTLRDVAKDTLKVVREGVYISPATNKFIKMKNEFHRAIEHSIVVPENSFFPKRSKTFPNPRLEITGEWTLQAAQRLDLSMRSKRIALLNFASAKKPGGGFLNGSQAQEETIARSSGLYPCLTKFNKEYYELHKKQGPKLLYTHTMIYSPDVPVFRDDRTTKFLDEPYQVDIITAAAPNACKGKTPNHDEIFKNRIDRVFGLAYSKDVEVLVLGAWGCGVFKNKYVNVAKMFAETLQRYHGAFSHITFALPDARSRVQFAQVFMEVDVRFSLLDQKNDEDTKETT